MRQTLPALVLVAACASALPGASRAAEPSDPPQGVVDKVGHAVVHGAQAAASGVERGAKAAAGGVRHAATAAGRGVRRGVSAAASGVQRGAHATAETAGRVAAKVKPAGSSPAAD